MDKRTFVVANPVARAGQVKKDWEMLERRLKTHISEFDVAFTEGPGHATLLAREALRAGWEMIVAVGGDGTLNEVVNGFFEKPTPEKTWALEDGWIKKIGESAPMVNPDAAFGFLPMGTGGDFRRSVGLMGDMEESIEIMCASDIRKIDLGELGYLNADGDISSRYFLNISGVGFSGLTVEYANKTWKGLGGKTSFRIASTRAFLKWKNVQMQIRLDELDEEEGRFFNVVIANGEFFGGGMWVAPGARLNDGKFQVIFMGDISRTDMAVLMSKIYTGHHLHFPEIYRKNASVVAVRSLDPATELLLDVDGEQPGTGPVTFVSHHGLLKMKA